MKTVTFCGHGSLSSEEVIFAKKAIKVEIERLILLGASEFLLGGYGAFDRIAAMAVKEMKQHYPHIKSTLVIPYIDREYDTDLYDCSEYPPIENTPKRFAIVKRNEYMVDCSDAIIAFVNLTVGGAAKTLAYAKRKKHIQIINIAQDYIQK